MLLTVAAAGLATFFSAACSGGGSARPADGGTGGSGAGGSDGGASADADGGAAEVAGGYTLDSFPGGFDFGLALPPTFARFLSLRGDEVTRETPGFHDQTSPEYFSYELLWWLTDAPDLSTSALLGDLSVYYTGLCAPPTPAQVTLEDPQAPGATADAGAGMLVARRAGTLDAGECFGAPVPPAALEVSTYHCPDHDAVLVLVSPRPAADDVWSELRAVRDTFTCH